MRTFVDRTRSACGDARGRRLPGRACRRHGRQDRWQTNGRVTAIAVVGSTAYIGGDFTAVRPPGKAAGKSTVARNTPPPRPDDRRSSAMGPGSRRQRARDRRDRAPASISGGEFSNAGGASADHIAAVDPNSGKRLSACTGSANDCGAGAGDLRQRVYAGGKFSAGQRRFPHPPGGAGCHHRTTISGFSASADKPVKTLMVVPGRNQLVVGGSLTKLDGAARTSVGSIDLVTGALQPWAPSFPFPVISIAATATGVYVAGGGDGGNFVAFDPATAAVISRGGTDGNAQAITVMNGIVYVGGHFTNYCGPTVGPRAVHRRHPAREAAGGRCHHRGAQPVEPRHRLHAGRVRARRGASSLAAGGDFTRVSDIPQQGFAAFR